MALLSPLTTYSELSLHKSSLRSISVTKDIHYSFTSRKDENNNPNEGYFQPTLGKLLLPNGKTKPQCDLLNLPQFQIYLNEPNLNLVFLAIVASAQDYYILPNMQKCFPLSFDFWEKSQFTKNSICNLLKFYFMVLTNIFSSSQNLIYLEKTNSGGWRWLRG